MNALYRRMRPTVLHAGPARGPAIPVAADAASRAGAMNPDPCRHDIAGPRHALQ